MNSAVEQHQETDPRRRLILALDLPSEREALKLADHLRPELVHVKVGLQLFSEAGPDVVRKLLSMGLEVFLDLKLHDIPNTMAGAVRALADLGAHLTTVHAAAGPEGIAAAVEAARGARGGGPRGTTLGVLAVTILTSFDERQLQLVYGAGSETKTHVRRLGQMALGAGALGLVASPEEVAVLRSELGPDPLLVVPGIRPSGSSAADQRRVATPAQALREGADFLVVGRPISQAGEPRSALQRILDEMRSAQ
jgi:orotidine-5'-phosphate decarboxylase